MDLFEELLSTDQDVAKQLREWWQPVELELEAVEVEGYQHQAPITSGSSSSSLLSKSLSDSEDEPASDVFSDDEVSLPPARNV